MTRTSFTKFNELHEQYINEFNSLVIKYIGKKFLEPIQKIQADTDTDIQQLQNDHGTFIVRFISKTGDQANEFANKISKIKGFMKVKVNNNLVSATLKI